MPRQPSRALLTATSLIFFQCTVFAADSSLSEAYHAVEAGHVREAQTIIQEVLRDQPENAEAHFVKAQLYVKSDQLDYARRELKTAQRLDPSMSFAEPAALQALRARVPASTSGVFTAHHSSVYWSFLILGTVGILAAIVMVLRTIRQLRHR